MGVEVSVNLRAQDYLSGAVDKSASKIHALERDFAGLGSRADRELQQISREFDAIGHKADNAGSHLDSFSVGGASGGINVADFGGGGGDGGAMSMLGDLGNMGSMLANPYAAAGAAVVALGTGVVTLTQHLNELSNEFADNRREVQMYFGELNDSQAIDNITARSGAMAKIFKKDASEINAAANVMAKEFGISADEAFMNVQKGLQASNGLMDLAQIREYSTQLKEAGFTAEQMAVISAESAKRGIYDDKALDAIKEAGLRLREQTQPVQDVIDKYGKALGVQSNFLNGIKTGSIPVMTAIEQLTGNLDKLDNKARQEVITNIFGGAGEDAGAKFFEMMQSGANTFDELIDSSDKFIIKQNKRLELETKINQKVAAIAPTMNDMSGKWDILVLKGKLFFYDIVQKGFEWWEGFVEGPTFTKLSNWWDDISTKASNFFADFGAQAEVFGGAFMAAFEPLINNLDTMDSMMQRIFGEHYISEFFQRELDGIIDAFKVLNNLLLSVEAITNPSKDKGIIGDMMDIWTNKKKNSTAGVNATQSVVDSKEYAKMYADNDKPFSPIKKNTLAGLTASERDKKAKDEKGALSGVVSGGGGVKNITVNLNVSQAYNIRTSGAGDVTELKSVANNSAKVVMDGLLQEIRNYEDVM
ncbi:MAG: hypothetical protein RIT30_1287 [Bacteroidota bacterium]